MYKLVLIVISFTILSFQGFGQIIFENTKAPTLVFEEWVENLEEENVLKDKHVVLEFWATWCGACIDAIPHINQLSEKYESELAFISVNSFEDRETILEFLSKVDVNTYKIIDTQKKLKNSFEVQTIPATILIDKNGMLRWKGYASDLSEELIDEFLENDKIINLQARALKIDKTLTTEIDGLPREIGFQLNQHIYNQMQQASSSIEKDFETDFIYNLKRFQLVDIIAFLFQESVENINYEEWSDVKMIGISPDKNYDIYLYSKDSGKYNEQIAYRALEELKTIFNFDLEIKFRNVDKYSLRVVNKDLLEKAKSPETDVTIEPTYDANEDTGIITITNISLNEFNFRLSELTKQVFRNNFGDELYTIQMKDSESIEELNEQLNKSGLELVKETRLMKVPLVIFNDL